MQICFVYFALTLYFLCGYRYFVDKYRNRKERKVQRKSSQRNTNHHLPLT